MLQFFVLDCQEIFAVLVVKFCLGTCENNYSFGVAIYFSGVFGVIMGRIDLVVVLEVLGYFEAFQYNVDDFFLNFRIQTELYFGAG